jgi:hypothetical protein
VIDVFLMLLGDLCTRYSNDVLKNGVLSIYYAMSRYSFGAAWVRIYCLMLWSTLGIFSSNEMALGNFDA